MTAEAFRLGCLGFGLTLGDFGVLGELAIWLGVTALATGVAARAGSADMIVVSARLGAAWGFLRLAREGDCAGCLLAREGEGAVCGVVTG